MKSRLAALGGRHRIALLVLTMVTTVLVAGGGGTTADAADPLPIDTPMTGILPVCAAQLHDSVSHDVWVEVDPGDPFDANHEAGLDQNCAWQNMQDRTDSNLWPRALNARALPDTVPINGNATTIQFTASGMAAPGPFNATVPDCMPLSTRPGGCSDNAADPTPYVAYRLANGAGQFVGRWKLVIDASDNPFFDLTRNTLSCADNYPNWSPGKVHTGLPCDFVLNFATSASGAPVLTSAMQVIVGIRWLYGTSGTGGNIGHEYGYTAVVPMLFTPGSSTSLKLAALPSPVPYGTSVALQSTAVGPPAGSAVNFYRRGSNGTAAFAGQALTDAAGIATLNVTATGNAEYWSRLVSGGTETAQSETRALTVTRGVGLAVKKKPKGKVQFTATLTPGTGAGPVLLQRKDKQKGWVTVKSGTPAAAVVWTLKPPKGKSWWRVLVPNGPDFVESVSAQVKVKRPR